MTRCNMSFDYMRRDDVMAHVTVSFDGISVINYTDSILNRPFGSNIKPTIRDVECLFEERCFPQGRGDMRDMILHLPTGYDTLAILEETHGVLVDDYFWIRFEGEKLTWDDVKHWKFH